MCRKRHPKPHPYSARKSAGQFRGHLVTGSGGSALRIVPSEVARFPASARFSDHAARIRAIDLHSNSLSGNRVRVELQQELYSPTPEVSNAKPGRKPGRYAPPSRFCSTHRRGKSVSKYNGESSPSN